MKADVSVHDLSKEYPTAAGPLHILQGVNVDLRRGETVAITGPSGSGKSTFLYILGTLDRPTGGTIQILDESPLEMNEAQLARFRSRTIGFIFQDHHLLPQCTVLENVLIPAIAADGAGPEQEQRAKELLGRVGLEQRLSHRPAQLSGGERQRVAVCRALINQPVLLLADEPTGNLDRATAESVGQLLLDLAREQQAILVCVTHSLELASHFPRRLDLREGTLVDVSTSSSQPPRLGAGA